MALRLGWYDFAFTRGFAARVAKSYHPARKAILDQQAWLKSIQPTRAHQCIVHSGVLSVSVQKIKDLKYFNKPKFFFKSSYFDKPRFLFKTSDILKKNKTDKTVSP